MSGFVHYTAILLAFTCAAMILMRIAGRLQRPFTLRKIVIYFFKVGLVVFALNHLDSAVAMLIFLLVATVVLLQPDLRDRHPNVETLHGTL